MTTKRQHGVTKRKRLCQVTGTSHSDGSDCQLSVGVKEDKDPVTCDLSEPVLRTTWMQGQSQRYIGLNIFPHVWQAFRAYAKRHNLSLVKATAKIAESLKD